MRSRFTIVGVLLGGIVIGFLAWFIGSRIESNLIEKAAKIDKLTAFNQFPIFVGKKNLAEQDTTLRPFAIALHAGKLFVSYLGTDRIDEFNEKLEFVRTFNLSNREIASITGVAIERDRLYAANYRTGELLIAEYPSGKLLHSIGLLPDNQTQMKLFGVTYSSENLYITDSRTNQVLVVSATTVPNLKEEGELLLHFPDSGAYSLSFPTFSVVTPDGRLLVSDVGNKEVKAFTCNGRFAHYFEKSGDAALSAPMGIGLDNISSPELQVLKDSVFDPSGVYEQGRIHVVDTKLARVKVFNSLGKYVLTYGEELSQPNGIVIDQKRRLIFITDVNLKSILLYKY